MTTIPPQCWSRHAFSSSCKSKMILNNMCESFNNVLKQARDKPILTHMEWMRRYVMQKNCSKMEGVHKLEAGSCHMCKNDLIGAINWELSGIPCQHAYVAIVYIRGDPHEYVEDWYNKERYMVTYEPIIMPMPGPKQWEKTSYLEPLPPPFKNMPGRPSKKKRRKKAGEDAQNEIRQGGKPNRCSNCRKYGHNKKSCKNATMDPSPKKKGGKPFSAEPWAADCREKIAKGKGKWKKKQKKDSTSIVQGHHVDMSSQASTVPLQDLHKFMEAQVM